MPVDGFNAQDEEWQAFLARVQQATTVLIPVWAQGPDHYTYLEATRPTVASSWRVTYADSLPTPSKNSMTAARQIARRLGLWKRGEDWPGTSYKGFQEDGWSCGLWVLRWIEARLRELRGEVGAEPVPLEQQTQRLTGFIHALKSACDPLGRIRSDCPLCTLEFTCAICDSSGNNAVAKKSARKQPSPSHTSVATKEASVASKTHCFENGTRKCGTCGKRGHRFETCPLRDKPIPQRGNRGSSAPHEWSNKYSYGAAGEEVKSKGGNVFRGLKGQQPSYTDICRMNDDAAKGVLDALGFLPPMPSVAPRLCFKCNAEMRLGTDGQLRCTMKKKCGVHFRAETAYTPLHNSMTSYAEYLKLATCFSCQLRIDQTELLADVPYDRVARVFAAFRSVCAWFTLHLGKG